jgi:hypothetical protein
MSGHIRRRGKNSWELKFDIGRDEATGKRFTQFHSFKGTRKEAQFKLAELIASVSKGSYVSRSRLTVAEHTGARIDQWVSLGKITPKTAERYRELLANQIVPHIGVKAVQKLKPADIEQCDLENQRSQRWQRRLKRAHHPSRTPVAIQGVEGSDATRPGHAECCGRRTAPAGRGRRNRRARQ